MPGTIRKPIVKFVANLRHGRGGIRFTGLRDHLQHRNVGPCWAPPLPVDSESHLGRLHPIVGGLSSHTKSACTWNAKRREVQAVREHAHEEAILRSTATGPNGSKNDALPSGLTNPLTLELILTSQLP